MNYCSMDVAMKSSYVYITHSSGRKQTAGEIVSANGGSVRQKIPTVFALTRLTS